MKIASKKRIEIEDLNALKEGIEEKRVNDTMVSPEAVTIPDFNLRTNEKAISTMANNMKQHGYAPNEPIILDISTNQVVNGVLRVLAARKAEIESIPAICYSGLMYEEKEFLSCDGNRKRVKLDRKSEMFKLFRLYYICGFSYEAIGEIIGECHTNGMRKLRILNTHTFIQRLYYDGKLVEKSVREDILEEVPMHDQKWFATKVALVNKPVKGEAFSEMMTAYEMLHKTRKGAPMMESDELPTVTKNDIDARKRSKTFLKDSKKMEIFLDNGNKFEGESDPDALKALLQFRKSLTRRIQKMCRDSGKQALVLSEREEAEFVRAKMREAKELETKTSSMPYEIEKRPAKPIINDTKKRSGSSVTEVHYIRDALLRAQAREQKATATILPEELPFVENSTQEESEPDKEILYRVSNPTTKTYERVLARQQGKNNYETYKVASKAKPVSEIDDD